MSIKRFKSSEDLIVWSDNTQCYRYEFDETYHSTDDYIIIPVGSLHYPDGVTIHEVDYDTVVNQRRDYVEKLRDVLEDKGE